MAIDPTPTPPYPLHESVVDKLDPEYVAFYNKHIINQQQVHYQPVAASRTSGKSCQVKNEQEHWLKQFMQLTGVLIPGAGEPSKIGATKDYVIPRKHSQGPDVAVRTFTPASPAPESGYPLLIWLHGKLAWSARKELLANQTFLLYRWRMGSWKHQHRERRMHTIL